jgi:Holliday junction resolvase RusA-like endonuclease
MTTMILKFSIDHIKLKSATRVRGSAAKGKKHFYADTEYKYYKDLLGGLISLKIDEDVKNLQNVYFIFRYRNIRESQDIDNIKKAILDCMVQQGIIIKDDRSKILKGAFVEAIESDITGLDVWIVSDELHKYKVLSEIIGSFGID